jgi:antitoxin component YwqK of YwqJK toxin-antitoxin module
MKKILLLIILTTNLSFAQEVTIPYDDITIIQEVAYLKHDMSLVTGKTTERSSKARHQFTYKDGILNGVSRAWNKKNKKWQLTSESTFIDNKQEGAFKSWYSDGQLLEVGNFKKGLRDGVCTTWDKSGKLTSEATYKDGKAISQ